MLNHEFLESQGLNLKFNIQVVEHFGLNGNQAINICFETKGIKTEATLSRGNYFNAFFEPVWQNLSISQKLVVCRWHMENYLLQKQYGADLPTFNFFVDQNSNQNAKAMANCNNQIYINLNYLQSSNGLDALETITHECVHFCDYKLCRKNYAEFCGVYFEKGLGQIETYQQILNLPVEGKIKNLQTGQWQYIDKNLQNQILLLKNYYAMFRHQKGIPQKKSNINSAEGFEKYLEQALYYCSPLETRANIYAIEYVGNIAQQFGETLGKSDKEELKQNKHRLNFLRGKKTELQKLYQMPLHNILNMEFVFTANNRTCVLIRTKGKTLIEKAKQIHKQLWQNKFIFEGITPWAQKQEEVLTI